MMFTIRNSLSALLQLLRILQVNSIVYDGFHYEIHLSANNKHKRVSTKGNDQP